LAKCVPRSPSCAARPFILDTKAGTLPAAAIASAEAASLPDWSIVP
jgi:hypothetical protein